MYQPALQGVLQAQRGMSGVVARSRDRKRAVLAHESGQIGAFEVLHREEGSLSMLAGVVYRDDVGMGETGRDLHLPAKAVNRVRVVWAAPANHLQGDDPIEPQVPCLVDDAHAA